MDKIRLFEYGYEEGNIFMNMTAYGEVKEYDPINCCTMLINYTVNNNISTKKYYNGNDPLATIKAPFEYQYSASWKDQLIRITRLVNGSAVLNLQILIL